VVANVGDSRVYLFHDGELEQITEDHSLVEDLVREGRLTAEEARTHPQRNVVTRVLGIEEDVEVDSWQIVPYTGDRFLLCSDGLFNEVDESDRRRPPPPRRPRRRRRRARAPGQRGRRQGQHHRRRGRRGRRRRPGRGRLGGAREQAGHHPLLDPAPPGAGGEDIDVAPRSGGVALATEPEPEPAARRSAPQPRAARPRRFTWRVALFSLAVLAVLAAAAGAVWWFARSTYYVGVDGEDVVIFQGRPGGVLWFQPTVAEPTDLSFEDVPPARRPDVQAGKQEATLEDARRYVERLEQQRGAGGAATTTTTSTSAPDPVTTETTAPPPTSTP
jgi:protein phosphatase